MTAIDAPSRDYSAHRSPHRVDDPWRHILVAIDGDPVSMAAVTRALELARRDRAGLSILYERARAAGLEVELIVRPGAAGQAIVEAAHDVDADLIVVGRNGRRHDIPGATATCGYVLTHSDRPVLVVQPWAPGPHGG